MQTKVLTPLHPKKMKSEHHLTHCLLAATQANSLDIKGSERMTSGEALAIPCAISTPILTGTGLSLGMGHTGVTMQALRTSLTLDFTLPISKCW